MRVGRTLAVLVMLAALSGCAWIDRSSVASRPAATEGNGPSGEGTFPSGGPSVSQSGRYVAFSSRVSNLVPNDVNGFADVFVHDHVTGSTELISVGALGNQGDTDSFDASISDGGRFVVFSTTTGLFSNPPARGNSSRIFLRDRQLGTTTPVYGLTGSPGVPTISGNGKVVAYLGGDVQSGFFGYPSTTPIVFDVATQTTKEMPVADFIDSSLLFGGVRLSLSDDGSRIAYSYVVRPPDVPQPPAALTVVSVIADTATAAVIATLRTSTISSSSNPPAWIETAISGDGARAYLAVSEGETGTLYRYDLAQPGLVPILTDISKPTNLRVSDDGNVVGFRQGGTFVITNASGAPPRVVSADNLDNPVTSVSGNVDLSGDGKWITFGASDSNLVAKDTNGVGDVFLRSTGYEFLPPT